MADLETKHVSGNDDPILSTKYGITFNDTTDACNFGPVGLAKLVAQKVFANRTCVKLPTKEFLRFNGNIWEPDTKGAYTDVNFELQNTILKAIHHLESLGLPEAESKPILKNLQDGRKALKSIKISNQIYEQALYGQDGCGVPAELWDVEHMEITTRNGILDLGTGILRPSSPEDYRTRCIACEFHPSNQIGTPLVLIQSLKEIFAAIGHPREPEWLTSHKDFRLEIFAAVTTDQSAHREDYADTITEKAQRILQYLDSFTPFQSDELHLFLNTQLDEGLPHAINRVVQKFMPAIETDARAAIEYKEQYTKWESGYYQEAMVTFMQELLGYCLLGTNFLQRFVILVGDKGRNGKGLLMHTVESILGEAYSVQCRSELFMQGPKASSGSATPELVALKGKRFVFSSENNRADALNAAFIKRVTGGDKLSGRGLYVGEESMSVNFVPILLSNFLPYLDPDDAALLNRAIIIPFPTQFTAEKDEEETIFCKKRDPQLESKLLDEKEQIFAWLVDGAVKVVQRNALNVPDFLRDAGFEERKSMDPINAFLDECCSQDSKERDSSREVYQAFSQWTDEHNFSKGMSDRTFWKRMEGRGFVRRKSNGIMYALGLHLNDEGAKLAEAYLARKRPGYMNK